MIIYIGEASCFSDWYSIAIPDGIFDKLWCHLQVSDESDKVQKHQNTGRNNKNAKLIPIVASI